MISFKILLFLTVCAIVTASKLPKNWKTCKAAKEMNQCLELAIEDAIHSLKDGMPSLGVLPLEPLHFDSVIVNQGSGPVAVNLTFTHVDLLGFGNAHIDEVEFNPKTMDLKFRINTTAPLVLKGDYSTYGKIIILPIQGKGKSVLTFDNFSGLVHLKGKIVEKNKQKYYHVDSFEVNINTSKLTMKFEGLFNGDKAMGDNMNKFLNENWQDILKELKPAISKAFGEGLKIISNRVFSKIPLKEIIPS